MDKQAQLSGAEPVAGMDARALAVACPEGRQERRFLVSPSRRLFPADIEGGAPSATHTAAGVFAWREFSRSVGPQRPKMEACILVGLRTPS